MSAHQTSVDREIEDALTQAYDALSDVVDTLDDLGETDLMHRADNLRSAIDDLAREVMTR